MENDYNDPSLRILIHGAERLKEELHSVERSIAQRQRELMGKAAPSSTPVDVGKYKNLRTQTALVGYLTDCGGGPVAVERIATDLREWGARLCKLPASRQVKTVRQSITTTNNFEKKHGRPPMFLYDVATDSVSLVRGTATPKPPRKAH